MNKAGKIRQYLLGSLPVEERTALEERYVTDAAVFEELVKCENDLVDSYVRGRLSSGERREFETGYLISAERRSRVEFARTLQKVAGESRGNERRPSALRRLILAAAAVASLTLVFAGMVVWIQRHQSQNVTVAKTAGRGPGQPRSDLAAEVIPAPSPANEVQATGPAEHPHGVLAPVAVLTLTPGLLRGSESSGQVLVLTGRTGPVELRLRTRNRHRYYNAEIQTVEGQTVANIDAERVAAENEQRPVVVVRVASALVGPGDYVVKLRVGSDKGGFEEIDAYSFRAVSQRAK
jgi:hypothetical protein